MPVTASSTQAVALSHVPYEAPRPADDLEESFDPGSGVLWVSLQPGAPSKMTTELLDALLAKQKAIAKRVRNELRTGEHQRVRYQVLASRIPGVFSLGGDLPQLVRLVNARDRSALVDLGMKCAELVYQNAVSYHLPVTTIALVQGVAMGGGFEAALSANVLVAERQSTMGLPEVLFNMFPGMGAYQLLRRRLPANQAQRLITSGRTYTAEELYNMGVVDVLAEPGEGEQAVWEFVKRHRRQENGEWGIRKMVNSTDPPLVYDDLVQSIEIWAESALNLSDTDVKHIKFLIRAQTARGN